MILLKQHRSSNAIRFLNFGRNNTWLVLGRRDPWNETDTPPNPEIEAKSVNDPIIAVRAEIRWVVPDAQGGFIFVDPSGKEVKFRELFTEESVLEENCRMCLIRGTVSGAIVDAPSFREIGFYTNLVPAESFQNQNILVPERIADYGVLETLEYRSGINITPSSTYTMSNIIEF